MERREATMLEKIAEILTVVKQQPTLKDHIISKCTLSSSTFNQYIKLLLENGLLDAYPAVNLKHTPGPKNHRRTIYQTSQKGKEFLKQYQNLVTLLGSLWKG